MKTKYFKIDCNKTELRYIIEFRNPDAVKACPGLYR